ncbi:unnamed protein product, partial [Pleuronectes platessa]
KLYGTVFRHGIDKTVQLAAVRPPGLGDEAKYWPIPIFSSLGDGCSFPSCLVNVDPEQPFSPTGSNPANKGAAEGRQFPSKPLRESQSRLLASTPSWTDSDSAAEKERKGASNQGMTIEHEA